MTVEVRVLVGARCCSCVGTSCWTIVETGVNKGEDKGAEKFEGLRL
jgi:hypothetical protein